MRRAIAWLRRDLRLSDNTTLRNATERAEQVAVAFVFDTQILHGLDDRDDRRVTFIFRSVMELRRKLRALGSDLVILHGDPVDEIPALARAIEAEAVFTAEDFEPYAIQRDRQVADRLSCPLITEVDHVVQPGASVVSGSGEPFKVFTPYARAWRARLKPEMLESRDPRVDRLWQMKSLPAAQVESLGDIGFEEGSLWLEAGEDAGHQRLMSFRSKLGGYSEARNFPAQEGTSGLSVHLRHGTVSIREAFRVGFEQGADKWVDELIWREFYAMILACFPSVVDEAFQPKARGIVWPGLDAHWDAWCRGMTGFPIVDAAMRCLNETGWMHNRLRMICASFLTKDLLIDYRRGEAYFARKLLDFELASNNGGWQWAASTGCDAQPYFRVFNPVLQSRKFDPEGAFIRRWCPELAELDRGEIHWPHGSLLAGEYPTPIVDHDAQRLKAIELFRDR